MNDLENRNQLEVVERIPLKMREHLPLVTIELEGKPLTFALDSGTECNLVDESYFKDFRSRMNLRKLKVNRLVSVDNLPETVKKVPISQIEFGVVILKNMDTLFCDLSHLKQKGKHKIDGLLGYELLKSQPTLISYSRSELVFYKNSFH